MFTVTVVNQQQYHMDSQGSSVHKVALGNYLPVSLPLDYTQTQTLLMCTT